MGRLAFFSGGAKTPSRVFLNIRASAGKAIAIRLRPGAAVGHKKHKSKIKKFDTVYLII